MKKTSALLILLVLLSGCGSVASPPASYQPTDSYSEASKTAAPNDENSGFINELENQNAQRAIERAEATYTALQSTTSGFTARQQADCNNPSMEAAIRSLQPVDDVAQYYMRQATSAAEPSDREAAMDVLDELNKVVLDGILDIAKAYRSKGCLSRAKHLMTEAKRIYSGPAYESWVSAMETELQSIEAAEDASRVTKIRR